MNENAFEMLVNIAQICAKNDCDTCPLRNEVNGGCSINGHTIATLFNYGEQAEQETECWYHNEEEDVTFDDMYELYLRNILH